MSKLQTRAFDCSKENVEAARQLFELTRSRLNHAKTYGTADHVNTAIEDFKSEAKIYAEALREHAADAIALSEAA